MRWSDGSLQLLIGNEVLDISVQEAQHDQAHLYLRHEKVKFLNLLGMCMCVYVIHEYMHGILCLYHKSRKDLKNV